MENQEFDVKGVAEKITKAMETKASKEEIKEIKKELSDSILEKESKIKSLEEKLANQEAIQKAQGKEITEGKEKSINDKAFSLKSFIKSKEDYFLEDYKKKSSTNVNLTFKAADTMTIAANTTGATSMTTYVPGIDEAIRRESFVADLITYGGVIDGGIITFSEHKNPDGGAGMVAEGAVKPLSDFDIIESSASVKKIAIRNKSSREILRRISQLETFIKNDLLKQLDLEKDAQLLSGDGLGNNLTGILTNATPFSVAGTPFALNVVSPETVDVLLIALDQVYRGLFTPNYIVMNNADVTSMKLSKGNDNHYIMPPFTASDGTTIEGVRVIKNTGVAIGTFLVGDFTKSEYYIEDDVNVTSWMENDDFSKNLITWIAEMSLVHYVKSNNYGAFVTGNIAAAKVLITKP